MGVMVNLRQISWSSLASGIHSVNFSPFNQPTLAGSTTVLLKVILFLYKTMRCLQEESEPRKNQWCGNMTSFSEGLYHGIAFLRRRNYTVISSSSSSSSSSSLEMVPAYKEPTLSIPGTAAIVQHEVLNNKRHILTKDTNGSVKLWEISRGIVVEDYGKVSFEEKKEKLFDMISIPSWFTVDIRHGCLSIHLDTPQCFSAEMYSVDLDMDERPEDDKVRTVSIKINVEGRRSTGLHWLPKRRHRIASQASANGDVSSSARNLAHSRTEVNGTSENESMVVYPPFEFSTVCPPSIITEGSEGGPWRKKITDLDGTEDGKDFPWWVLDCVLNNRLPPRENTKIGCFYSLDIITYVNIIFSLGHSEVLTVSLAFADVAFTCSHAKVVSYVLEKTVLDNPLDNLNSDGTFSPALAALGDSRSGINRWRNPRPIEVLSPDMSLATVRAYIWKKPEDLILNYRLGQGRRKLMPESALAITKEEKLIGRQLFEKPQEGKLALWELDSDQHYYTGRNRQINVDEDERYISGSTRSHENMLLSKAHSYCNWKQGSTTPYSWTVEEEENEEVEEEVPKDEAEIQVDSKSRRRIMQAYSRSVCLCLFTCFEHF
ncbi:hypothetical protein ACFE04_004915 [Oxalis oulophora]